MTTQPYIFLKDPLESFIKRSYLKVFPVRNPEIRMNILILLLILKMDEKSVKPLLSLNFSEVVKENNIVPRLLEIAQFLTNTIPNLSIFLRILDEDYYKFELKQCRGLIDNKSTFIKNLCGLKFDWDEDILGFAYQMCIGKNDMQDMCAYYTPASKIKSIMGYLHGIQSQTPIFDPFCGTGRISIIGLPFASGYDYDHTAVDIANINKLLYHGIINNPFIVQDFNELSYEDHKHDYIFTNIPFQKSAKQNEVLIINLSKMVGKQAAVILPSGHFDKIKNFPKTHDFKIIERLDIDTFYPFTKVSTEILLINSL